MVDSLRMPVIFVGHGNPMNAILPNAYTDAWRAMAASFPKRAASSPAKRRPLRMRSTISVMAEAMASPT